MKIRLQFFTAVTALALLGNAWAQSIAIPTTVVIKGDTGTVNMAFTAGGTATNLDFIIDYDETVVDEAALAIDCSTTIPELTALNCSVDTTLNQVKGIGVNFGSTELSSTDPFAVITLPVLVGAASGDSVQNFVANFFDVLGVSVGTQNGTWTVTVSDGPQPLFAATPASVALSGQISTTLEADVVIDNNGGDDGSTLTYTCAVPAGKFTLSGDTTDFAVAKGSSGTVTVACDSSAIGGPFNDTMSCTHDGSNTTPVDIPLSCTVTAGPEPAYTGVEAGLVMVATEQGDPDPTGSVAITNTGDATTTLTGTCTLAGPDAQITVSNGAFSVAEGAAAHSVAVSCDASAEGSYANTLSCTHNGTNTPSPVDYTVTCEVGPPGPAVYASTPADGAVIDMTTEDVPVGAVVPDQVLTITNDAAEANDRDLVLANCAFVGDAAITATAPTSPVAAQASTSVTFSCDTAAVGAYTGTYSCDYSETGSEAFDGQATYTVNCGVRAAASDILEAPVSGTALSMVVPIGGTGQASVNFSEILDEGVDATVDSCSFGTADFSVVTTMPATVTAGSTATVTVEGTDPGDGTLVFNDTLTCTYTDSDNTPGTASWPITMTVATAVPIPTLSVWGLMLMILTLVGLGGMVMRRKVES